MGGVDDPAHVVTEVCMNDLQTRVQPCDFARADVYRLLSACFYQPEDAFLEEDVFGQLKTAMAIISPPTVPDTVALESSFNEVALEELQLDYSRLFLGPFEILAKPYGSVFLDGEKVVMGDSTIKALGMYREGNFEMAKDFREMPDHVAVELEFLYLLSFNIGQASANAERDSLMTLKKKFLKEHLGKWITPLSEAIRNGAKTDFYRRLAELTQKVVREDMQEFREVV